MGDAIRVNGNQHSWGSIVLKIAGENFYGFTDITYGDKLEKVLAYGMGKAHAPRGKSRGKYTPEPVKLTGFKGSAHELRTMLAKYSKTGKSYGNVNFQIVVEYIESGETPLVIELMNCSIAGDSSNHSESADPLKDEIEVQPTYVKRNGMTLFEGELNQY
jgi:hypothetical protein